MIDYTHRKWGVSTASDSSVVTVSIMTRSQDRKNLEGSWMNRILEGGSVRSGAAGEQRGDLRFFCPAGEPLVEVHSNVLPWKQQRWRVWNHQRAYTWDDFELSVESFFYQKTSYSYSDGLNTLQCHINPPPDMSKLLQNQSAHGGAWHCEYSIVLQGHGVCNGRWSFHPYLGAVVEERK